MEGRHLGEKRSLYTKITNGVIVLCLLLMIIWFPLFIFSGFNTLNEPDPVVEMTMEFSVGNAPYLISIKQTNISPFLPSDSIPCNRDDPNSWSCFKEAFPQPNITVAQEPHFETGLDYILCEIL